MPQLFKDGEQLSKRIATSFLSDIRKINEKILTHCIIKLCYTGSSTIIVRPRVIINESSINSTDTGTYVYVYSKLDVVCIIS